MSMRNRHDARTVEIVHKYERVLEAIHQAPAPFAVYDDEDVLIAWNPAYQNLHPDAFKGQAPDDARRLGRDDVVRLNAVNVYADDRLGGDVAKYLREPHLIRTCADTSNDAESDRRQIFTFIAPANVANGLAVNEEYLKRAKRVIPDFDHLVASSHTGAVLVDKALTVRMVNQAYYDLWDLSRDDGHEGQPVSALLEASFRGANISVEAENRKDFIASQCNEIADGRVSSRELVLKSGQTLIYSVRELAGSMRLVTYLDPVSRAVPGRNIENLQPVRQADPRDDVNSGAAMVVSADAAEKALGPMARIWRNLPDKYAGHVSRLHAIATRLIGNPAALNDSGPDVSPDVTPDLSPDLSTDASGVPHPPALTGWKPEKLPSTSGVLPSNMPGNETGQVDILVCEDNDANQFLFTQVLRASGYTFRIANNGHEGVELYKSCRPRLILMDVVMPEMDGLAATTAIRDLEADTAHHTPIIAVTAHAGHGDKDLCFKAGMDDFVSKPVSPSKLEQKISSWLTDHKDAISA